MLKAKIVGLKEITEGLKRAPEKTVKEVGRAIEKSTILVHNQSLREAPVNKQGGGGNLRQLIKWKLLTKLRGEVRADAKYSGYVHEGTRPHIIKARNKKVLANERAGKIFGKVVRHPGTKPNPFLLRALKKSTAKMNRFFQTAINNVAKL